MKTLLSLLCFGLFWALSAEANLDRQVAVSGPEAKQIFYAISQTFSSFKDHAYLDDRCMATWLTPLLIAEKDDSTGQLKVWMKIYRDGQVIKSEKLEGNRLSIAFKQAGIGFGPGDVMRDLDCTLRRGGLDGCANESDQDQFECSLTISAGE